MKTATSNRPERTRVAQADPGQVSDPTVEDSPLNQSFTSAEFADFLPDTSHYFEVWLENIRPSLEPNKNHTPPRELTVANAPAPGECRIEGTFEGTLRVDGYVTGFLRSLTGTLIVGESGEVESDIVVAIAIIDGFLRGDIHATERLELGRHARVFGKIESPALSIAPGAVFEGECHFLPSHFKADSEDDGRISSSNPTFSSTDLSSPNEEEAESLAVAASR
jgi:cytoskeletal protein CcmA (bactofilin family)